MIPRCLGNMSDTGARRARSGDGVHEGAGTRPHRWERDRCAACGMHRDWAGARYACEMPRGGLPKSERVPAAVVPASFGRLRLLTRTPSGSSTARPLVALRCTGCGEHGRIQTAHWRRYQDAESHVQPRWCRCADVEAARSAHLPGVSWSYGAEASGGFVILDRYRVVRSRTDGGGTRRHWARCDRCGCRGYVNTTPRRQPGWCCCARVPIGMGEAAE